jgi:hypothetical protein
MDLNKIHIFDNFLSLEEQDELERQIIINTGFKWRATYSRIFKPPPKEELGDSRPLALDAPKNGKIKIKNNIFWNQDRPGLMVGEYFEHGAGWVYGYNDRFITSPLKKLGLNYELQRIKVNFNPREIIEHKGSCYVPHVDIENGGGWTGIYYVNESDGDTVIFNEKTNNPIRNNEEISVKEVINNKRGRLVIFNQNLLHAGCPPIESNNRIVINFNFKLL